MGSSDISDEQVQGLDCLINKSAPIWKRRGIRILSAFNLRATKMFDLALFLQAF